MSVKTEHYQSNTSYFCTFTCNRWINLFSITDFYDQIYMWFDHMVKHGYQILGYVIMPNHTHFLIHTPQHTQSLNRRVGTGKRFMAYEIVERLKQRDCFEILSVLTEDVKPFDRRGGKLHQVFTDSFDAKEILNEEMLIQKLDYMHHNPVSGKWNLVEDFVNYPHSSANFMKPGFMEFTELRTTKEIWG